MCTEGPPSLQREAFKHQVTTQLVDRFHAHTEAKQLQQDRAQYFVKITLEEAPEIAIDKLTSLPQDHYQTPAHLHRLLQQHMIAKGNSKACLPPSNTPPAALRHFGTQKGKIVTKTENANTIFQIHSAAHQRVAAESIRNVLQYIEAPFP